MVRDGRGGKVVGENVEFGATEGSGTVTMETVVGDDVGCDVEGVVGVMVISGGVDKVLTTTDGIDEVGGDGVFIMVKYGVAMIADDCVVVVVSWNDVLVVMAAVDMLVVVETAKQEYGASVTVSPSR